MTIEDFISIVGAQGGQCGICQCRLERPVIDHDHATGQVRGVLCFRCNNWLAAIENTSFSEAAHRYLHKHAHQPPAYNFFKNSRHHAQLRHNKAKQTAKRKAQPRIAAIQERMARLIN